MAAPKAEQDARRFQAWQLAALESHPAGTELLKVGPFSALVPAAPDSSSWITLVEQTATRSETVSAVERLRAIFKSRAAPLEIEFNEALFPGVGRWLEDAGLTLSERNPLMACGPAGFKPFAAGGVTLDRLTTSSATADLQVFQAIRWTDGGENVNVPPPVEQLRRDLASPTSVYLLARVNEEAAGTGVSHALRGAVEIVGVVTKVSLRRRGVAATVTADLLSRHFGSGGDFAFLDSANDEATRVYERIGFTTFGANLVYR